MLGMASAVVVVTPLEAAAAAPSGWKEVARDTFTRTLSNSWGQAEAGGSYAVSASAGSSVKTSGSAGLVTISAGRTVSAALPSVVARDVYVADTMKVTSSNTITSDIFHGWAVRQQSDGSAYAVRLRLSSSGAASLGVSRLKGSTSTWLGGVNLPFTLMPGQAVRGEVEVAGTSPVAVKARVYPAGSAVPGWQMSVADSAAERIQTSGSVALREYAEVASSPVTVSRDDLTVSTPPLTDTGLVPPPSSGRGALPIGTANYPIPSGAIFVDVARGSDSNSGTQSSALRTVGAAIARARSGATVVLRAGTYHESVTVPSNKTLTFQAYPNEAVWFDGSTRVTNWARSGSTWVASGWTAEFSNSMGGTSWRSTMIDQNPMAADPDQVFVNGVALKQVGSSSSVTTGTFYVNDAANTITIGSDPTGKEVRASDLPQALQSSSPNTVVQGIGFRRYATGYERNGTVWLIGAGGAVRNVAVVDNATIGLRLSNGNKTVDRVTVERNGMLGIAGYKSDHSSITNSIVSNNNTENFKDVPVAGGIKLTAGRNLTVKNVETRNNLGTGIWFDVSCYNMTIVNNVSTNNRKHQIEVEVSDRGIIANNVATGGEDGIILFDAGNFRVFNNEVGGSKLFGIILSQDQRRQAAAGLYPEARDPRAPIPDPTMPWLTRNVVVSNNVFGNGGYFQWYALDKKTGIPVNQFNVTITGNLFNARLTKTDPTMVAWGKGGDNVTLERYETPAALAAAKNRSWLNAQTTSSKSLAAMAADKAAHASVAVPVPQDVASATGLVAGSRRLGVG